VSDASEVREQAAMLSGVVPLCRRRLLDML
jgi:hypothetical protein